MSNKNDDHLRRIKDLTIELKALKIRKSEIEEEINTLASIATDNVNDGSESTSNRPRDLFQSVYYSDRDGTPLNIGDTVSILTKGRSAKTNTRALVVGLDRGSYIVLRGQNGKEIIRYPRNVRIITKGK